MTPGPILDRPDYDNIPGRFNASKLRTGWKWDPMIAQVRRDAVARIEAGLEPQWAVVAVYTKGGRFGTMEERKKDRKALNNTLLRYRNEKWKIAHRTIPDTWYHRQLLLLFGGFMTDEEAEVYWAARRAGMERMIARKKHNARVRDHKKALALEAEVAAMREASIRARNGRMQ